MASVLAVPSGSSDEPTAIEAGTYLIPSSAWSVTDFTVTLPEGWTVQYGHVYAKKPDQEGELGFYAVVVDEIFTDACHGEGVPTAVGPAVDDLVSALLAQRSTVVSDPVASTLGGYAAVRVDLEVPQDLNLRQCRLHGIGLQIWHSVPADKYFVLLPDGSASVYILDVNGRRQVFLTQHRAPAADQDVDELRSVLDSIRIRA